MNASSSISRKMQPLKAYCIESGNNINFEIESYSVALDEYRSLMDQVLRECFISTAESFGLDMREKNVGDVNSDYPVERRRQMMILRNLVGENDFTLEGLSRFLKCFGVADFSVIEMPSENTIAIYVGGEYSLRTRNWIERQIDMMVPAHLIYTVTFRGILWSEIDDNTMTFGEMDSKNYTWKYINNIE